MGNILAHFQPVVRLLGVQLLLLALGLALGAKTQKEICNHRDTTRFIQDARVWVRKTAAIPGGCTSIAIAPSSTTPTLLHQ